MGPIGILGKDSGWRCRVENSEQSENSEGGALTLALMWFRGGRGGGVKIT